MTDPARTGIGSSIGEEIFMQNEWETVFENGLKATLRETSDGQLELSGDSFINRLIELGFHPSRNDSPERLAEILKNVPPEYRQDFLDGCQGM
jgi:hypothetical protein